MKLDYDRTVTNKTISVDFDDTLCLTTTRDWDNAEPKLDIINRVNALYDKGWQVLIVTARGQLSCDGDTELADKKYRTIIENWLNKHGVKYHILTFQKYLASYYLDDKSIGLDEFLDLEIQEIKTGWSGAKVEKRGNRIFKTHTDSLQAAEWYNKAAPLVNVPIVHSMIGQTICLEYLESNGHYFKLDEVNNAIEKFTMSPTTIGYNMYIEKIRSHIKYNNLFDEILPSLYDSDFFHYCDNRSTFMHGDLSLENVIQTDNGLFFIDPIYNKENWSSYLLDISKMLHSFRKYNRMFEYEVFMNMWVKKGESKQYLQLLEISQWIRILRYCPDQKMKNEYIKITNDLIKNYIKII